MAKLTLNNISKTYGRNNMAVKDFSLEIKDGEFVVLVGPSGCGKTTVLRMIAGLETTDSGEILLDGTSICDMPSQKRDIAMVFQNYALYPTMTVFDNIAFPLKMRRQGKEEIQQRVETVAETLEITELLHRKPGQLSGGEKQRVAMGRAMIREPKLFLMDEPLSNLDAKLRISLRGKIAELHRRLQTTTIYVTHDQAEAMTLADKLVVMRDGRIEQVGTPAEIYNRPLNPFVAGFFGDLTINFFEKEGIVYAIRPENVEVVEYNNKLLKDWIPAEILREELLGAKKALYLKVEETTIIASVDAGRLFSEKKVLVRVKNNLLCFNNHF